MKLKEAVKILNTKQKTVSDLARQFNVSKDLMGDVLKENGYPFNRKTQLRIYTSDGEEPELLLEELLEERVSAVGKRKRVSTLKGNIKNREKFNKKTIVETEALNLTEDEIKFVKELFKGRADCPKGFELVDELSKLPPRKPTKKANYEISLETFERFEDFAKKISETKRMSRNDLVEMALQKFMREFG
ncbi:hypothetical protein ACQKL0_20080 [Peribacillus sp. NPDC097264]|uniref:hypothetical protein n=1 Tax=Peribacillus sp. NPDC097264 TaxID=3390616 RepID=UPI003D05683F